MRPKAHPTNQKEITMKVSNTVAQAKFNNVITEAASKHNLKTTLTGTINSKGDFTTQIEILSAQNALIATTSTTIDASTRKFTISKLELQTCTISTQNLNTAGKAISNAISLFESLSSKECESLRENADAVIETGLDDLEKELALFKQEHDSAEGRALNTLINNLDKTVKELCNNSKPEERCRHNPAKASTQITILCDDGEKRNITLSAELHKNITYRIGHVVVKREDLPELTQGGWIPKFTSFTVTAPTYI